MAVLLDISEPDLGVQTGETAANRIRWANELSIRGALNPHIRRLAASILAPAHDIPRDAPRLFRKWIFRHLTYLMESPGVELLQGVETTTDNGVVDCDCAAIYWVALMRACGLRAFVAGIGRVDRFPALVHAVGWYADRSEFWELSDDRRYTGRRPSERFVLPAGYFALYYSHETGLPSWYMKTGANRPWEKIDRPRKSEMNPTILDESLDGCMGCTMASCLGCTMGAESKQAPDAPPSPIWELLQTIASGGMSVWEASVAPEGYTTGPQYYFPPTGTQDQTAALLAEQRLQRLEAQQGGVPTAVWVIGGLAVAGLVVWAVTREK